MNLKLTFEPSVTWIQLAPSRPQMAACLRPSRWRLLRYSPHDIFRQVLQIKIFRRKRNEGISDDHSIWCRPTESNVQKKWLRAKSVVFSFNLKRFVQQRLRWFQRERERASAIWLTGKALLHKNLSLRTAILVIFIFQTKKCTFLFNCSCFKIRTTLLQSVCKHKVVKWIAVHLV